MKTANGKKQAGVIIVHARGPRRRFFTPAIHISIAEVGSLDRDEDMHSQRTKWVFVTLFSFFVTSFHGFAQEFRVNEYVDYEQNRPAIATLMDGGFVIVWASQFQDGAESSIYGRLFDAEGKARGSEFRVNTYTAKSQFDPAVAALPDGSFVVCWVSHEQDGSGEGIFAQRFDARGAKLGEEFQVNTYNDSNQNQPEVLALRNDTFIIRWWSANQSSLFAQRFDLQGNRIGNEFQLKRANEFAMTALSGGGYLLVWLGNFSIWGQAYDSAGNPVGGEIQFNTTQLAYSDSYLPLIAELRNGNFVLLWHERISVSPEVIAPFVRLLNAEGQPLSEPVKLEIDASVKQLTDHIIALGESDFLVCWDFKATENSYWRIMGQVFTSGGKARWPAFPLNSRNELDNVQPQLARLGDDKFVLAWAAKVVQSNSSRNYDIFARIYPAIPTTHVLHEFSLLAPANGAISGNTDPTFRWQQPSNFPENFPWEITFDFYLDTLASFTNAVIRKDLRETAYHASDLLPGKIYYWKVQAKNLANETKWSASPYWTYHVKTRGRPPLPGEESGWTWRNPLPQGSTLTDLHLARPGAVLAAGSGGSFLATESDGARWERIKNAGGAYQQINDVFFINDTLAWAVGESNTVINSFDGGKCWFQVKLPGANWTGVHFINPYVGWLAGYYWNTVDLYGPRRFGVIYRTVDAGKTWKEYYWPFRSYDSIFYDLYFLSDQVGFAVGRYQFLHAVYHTVDGGETWSEQVVADGMGRDLQVIHFANDHDGWVVGKGGNVLRTDDGGQTWVNQISGTTRALNDVFFTDHQNGWAVGDTGTALFTKDGGLNWQATTAATTQNLLAVKFSDLTNGWAAGTYGEILRTRDGGRSWTSLLQAFTQADLEEMIFADAQSGWMVGRKGALFKTTDGGQNWVTKQSGVTNDLRRIQFLNADTGWIAGSHTLLRTTNGGEGWSRLLSWSGVDYGSTTLQFVNAKVGMVVNGNFVRTEDGGRTWFSHYAGIAGPKHNIYFFDADTGLVFGEWSGGGGDITMTTDGGKTWKLVGEAPVPAWDVFFLDRKIGWAVGGSGVTKTENGGLSWRRTAQSPVRARAVHFVDSELGYIAGENGAIYFTTNGGEKWQQLKSGTGSNLRSVSFTDAYTGWIVGDGGALLKTTTGGFDFYERICTPPAPPPPPKPPALPVTFVLYQNLPNPFKDFTTIDYVMTGTGHVTLKVYNILGHPVRTLVNAVQGEEIVYTVLWRGESDEGYQLPSGVYFYRFEAGGHAQTKKILLLR